MTVRGLTTHRFARWAGHAALAMSLVALGCESDDDADHDHDGDTQEGAKEGTKPSATSGGAVADKGGAAAQGATSGKDKPQSDKGARPEGSNLEPVVVPLSETGHDRFYGVTYDKKGNIFAVGQVAEGVEATTDFSLAVAKFDAKGGLDRSFGKDGVATQNVAVGGTVRENARGIVVQSSGKVVIAGAAEHDPSAEGLAAQDTDIVLLRFDADGKLDASFGNEGVVVLDLNSGIEGVDMMGMPAWQAGDSQWALEVDSKDRLLVHGSQRAEGEDAEGQPRKDADWALLRLTADGELDSSFGEGGKVTLDLGQAGASPRGISLLPDGSIIATGYLNSSVLGEETQQPVIYKVNDAGEFDADFATADATEAPGVWHDFAVKPPLRAEAYGAALQGDKLVTMGYGPSPSGGMATDWVSFRFNADGERDLAYGTDGAAYIDADGYGDNGRFVLVLPDQRILGLGGGRPAPAEAPPMGMQPPADAMIALLDKDGKPDASLAPGGFQLFDLGGNDFFWSGALSPDKKNVVIAGIAGGATMNVDDDNAVIAVLPIDSL